MNIVNRGTMGLPINEARAWGVEMSLEQYWKIIRTEEVAYHKKFNALHGFMEDVWRSQGYEGEFNCRDLYITTEILDELEKRAKKRKLLPTSGFFFGSDKKDAGYRADVKELLEVVIPKARELLAKDEKVVYTSWW